MHYLYSLLTRQNVVLSTHTYGMCIYTLQVKYYTRKNSTHQLDACISPSVSIGYLPHHYLIPIYMENIPIWQQLLTCLLQYYTIHI